MTWPTAGTAWAFGWEALVAIGTILLAVATAVLALLTRRVASSSAADVRAQWRPAVIPGRGGDYTSVIGAMVNIPLQYAAEQQRLFVNVRNVGRGPALHLRATLRPDGIAPVIRQLATLAAGDETQLRFEKVPPAAAPRLVAIDYVDLSGQPHAAELELGFIGDELVFSNVRTSAGA